MNASGDANSTTRSGISGGALTIRDESRQLQLTGQSAAETVASINRDTSDTGGALAPIFDKEKIQAGFDITSQFINQVGTFVDNRVKEADAAQMALDKEKSKSADQQDAARIAQLTQTVQENSTWQEGGTGRRVLTAITAAVGGNVTGSAGTVMQSAAAYYLQSLAVEQVKGISDALDSESARAALQSLVGCAGAATSSKGCGAGAAGAAASVVLNNLLDGVNNIQTSTLTNEEKLARERIVQSIVAGTTSTLGGDAATASIASLIEAENNAANFVKGTTPRMQVAATSVADVLRKPRGALTRADIDAQIATLNALEGTGNLSNQEALNLSSLWMALVERSSVENLMTPQEVVGSKQAMQAAIASMMFSGGGDSTIGGGGNTAGPKLPSTGGSRTGYRTSGGQADSASGQDLRVQLNQDNLGAIASQDARLSKAIKGDGTGNRNFSIGTGTAADAERLGQIWVGDGARSMKDVSGGLVSADGTRTYRPPQAKDSPFAVTGTQANFQQFQNGQMISNGHLNIHP
ncbi:MAG: hypothetical protein IOC39_05495 [Burkholderia sp.]|uniref:hypothetical protein n=1 Tax=Burkholderia sp. TaxID=36773 RepID=UPI00258CDF65|nr:hypothetical protein [Burkholderia sp.]MCA3778775.1 hypothetical protein [Burkholderia sp.]MCA3803347.1 hypothetical protein [Burkholderia sp.]MCA3809289.1 hypothetical protein [Burkholderia sp.]MCA3815257.1 hypothetical protein [Burkholderia sp.]MCA3830764.1 hypothetical protein [Burkholderia sp.]